MSFKCLTGKDSKTANDSDRVELFEDAANDHDHGMEEVAPCFNIAHAVLKNGNLGWT